MGKRFTTITGLNAFGNQRALKLRHSTDGEQQGHARAVVMPIGSRSSRKAAFLAVKSSIVSIRRLTDHAKWPRRTIACVAIPDIERGGNLCHRPDKTTLRPS